MKTPQILFMAISLVACFGYSAMSQTYSVLHRFATTTGTPRASLAQGPNGELYGITASAPPDDGIVYRILPNGTGFTVLTNIPRLLYGFPQGGLALSGTNLYGTTAGMGAGWVYKLNTDGTGLQALKQFNGSDGGDPYGRLLVVGSTLYGTTFVGGTAWQGTVYKLDTTGTGFTILKNFTRGYDGGEPEAGLTYADGWLYGTTSAGGSNDWGTVFRMETNGQNFTVLHDFNNSDGSRPQRNLFLFDATLFGIAQLGGLNDAGTMFKLQTDGRGFRILKHFGGADGSSPVASDLVKYGDLLYGTTGGGGRNGYGTLYCVNTDGGDFAVLYNFGGVEGGVPAGGLVLSGGALFGVTSRTSDSDLGVFFRFLMPPFLEIPNLVNTGKGLSFSWMTAAGQSYTVKFNENLATTNWLYYTNIAGTGGWTTLEVPVGGAPQRFFRVYTP